MSGYYLTALICLNGHILSRAIENSPQVASHCPKCGESTIHQCPNCNAKIKGHYVVPNVIDFTIDKSPAPNYCYNCGKPFPWTERFLSNATELIGLDSDLTNDEKETIKLAIKDLIIESPSSKVSAVKYKLNIEKATETIKSAMRDLLVDFLSDSVKKLIFGS